MEEHIVKIKEVNKSYHGSHILDNINLSVKQGETIGLVGINGVGKTTLLKCILELNSFDSGETKLFGLNNKLADSRKHLIYLPEKFFIPGYFSALDYIKFILQLHNIAVNKTEIENVLTTLYFPIEKLKMATKDYSKGMLQKVGLAACLLARKKLMILDEPMSGLDPQARMCLKKLLLAEKSKGNSFIISTHMLIDAVSLCDRLLVLHNGNFIFDESPQIFTEQFGEHDYDAAFMNCIGGIDMVVN